MTSTNCSLSSSKKTVKSRRTHITLRNYVNLILSVQSRRIPWYRCKTYLRCVLRLWNLMYRRRSRFRNWNSFTTGSFNMSIMLTSGSIRNYWRENTHLLGCLAPSLTFYLRQPNGKESTLDMTFWTVYSILRMVLINNLRLKLTKIILYWVRSVLSWCQY